MGGKNEAKVEQFSPIGKEGKVGEVRFHVSNDGSRVDFHDDKEKLVVRVPIDRFFNAWSRISKAPGDFHYIDQENQTCLSIFTSVEDYTKKPVEIDANIMVGPLLRGKTFIALQGLLMK